MRIEYTREEDYTKALDRFLASIENLEDLLEDYEYDEDQKCENNPES